MTERRVLIVDDSEVTRAVLARTLRGAGFAVLEAHDGVDGAVQALRELPDLVVTDIEMPHLEGFPLLRLLKSDPATAHIPVLVLTGETGIASRFWSLRTGADAYLTKDHEPRELLETVERLALAARVGEPAEAGAPMGPVEVLGRVASHLDQSLLQATLVNTLLERGMAAADFDEAGHAALETLGDIVDSRLLAVAVGETDEAMIHVLLQEPIREEDLEELTGRLVESLELAPATPVEVEFSGDRGDGEPVDLSHCVWFPLAVRGARATLCLLPREPQRFDARARALLEGLAGHLALVLDNARLAQRLRELSTLDSLTRLLNHRAILDRLTVEIEGARRYGHPVSVILCDFDHFKEVNDTHGHLAGDRVLREGAAALQRSLRATDILGRYGGEEFLVVLPSVDLDPARQAAERLRRALAESTMVLPTHEEVRISASFGVAASGELAQRLSADPLVSLADRRLYEAKAAGRNRVRP
ncbi:MAG TPA: diguanylate cyclase [Thermoanaerobaculia bacterium]|nr:diguanylate cyclase [Thermoanaerobaculia bacterium]